MKFKVAAKDNESGMRLLLPILSVITSMVIYYHAILKHSYLLLGL